MLKSQERLNMETAIKTPRTAKPPLSPYYDVQYDYEIGVDEAGRGPLFGRLYVAAVVLPKDGAFRHNDMKDSKKFSSKTKIREVAEYIKANALAYHVYYAEAPIIDKINIRQAVLQGMHECIRQNLLQMKYEETNPSILLLIDGNDFKPYTVFDEAETLRQIPHVTVEGGDNKYTAIAAASILAKVARDDYIAELCAEYPELSSRYAIDKNMGYGTKLHLDGILEHGITQWHRRTYGRCSSACDNFIREKDVYTLEHL